MNIKYQYCIWTEVTTHKAFYSNCAEPGWFQTITINIMSLQGGLTAMIEIMWNGDGLVFFESES